MVAKVNSLALSASLNRRKDESLFDGDREFDVLIDTLTELLSKVKEEERADRTLGMVARWATEVAARSPQTPNQEGA